MATVTTTTLPAPVQVTFDYKLLAVPTPNFIHTLPATQKAMPRNGGKKMRMSRFNRLQPALVPLGNSGVTPPGQGLSAVNIDAEIQFYGTYVEINDQVTLTNQCPVLNETAKLLGISLRETEDALTRDMLAATASVINATAGVNGDNPTEITRSDIGEVTRTLLSNNAWSITNNIEGQNKFGTAPVRNAFFALTHTNLSKTLEDVTGFIHNSQYPGQKDILPSEWGSIGNMRFLLSSVGSIVKNGSNAGADIYNTFCVGMDAYTVIRQDGYSAKFIYRPPIFSGPLAQNVTLGYTFAQACRVTNDAWVLNLRSTLA